MRRADPDGGGLNGSRTIPDQEGTEIRDGEQGAPQLPRSRTIPDQEGTEILLLLPCRVLNVTTEQPQQNDPRSGGD